MMTAFGSNALLALSSTMVCHVVSDQILFYSVRSLVSLGNRSCVFPLLKRFPFFCWSMLRSSRLGPVLVGGAARRMGTFKSDRAGEGMGAPLCSRAICAVSWISGASAGKGHHFDLPPCRIEERVDAEYIQPGGGCT